MPIQMPSEVISELASEVLSMNIFRDGQSLKALEAASGLSLHMTLFYRKFSSTRTGNFSKYLPEAHKSEALRKWSNVLT